MRILSVFLLTVVSVAAVAAPQSVRWTDDKNAELAHVVSVIQRKTGVALAPSDFLLWENRRLATSHFYMYTQMAAGLPRKKLSIRIWTVPSKTGPANGEEAIQVDARIDARLPASVLALAARGGGIDSQSTMAITRATVAKHPDDPRARSVTWQDTWDGARLVRVVKAVGARGTHRITIDTETDRVLDARYEEFPQHGGGEISIPTQVFPIYEEVEQEGGVGQLLSRVPAELRYINATIEDAGGANPYRPLATQQYLDTKYDPLLGLTEEGRKQGFWAPTYLKGLAREIRNKLPSRKNTFADGGVLLSGRYVTVGLHPAAADAFKNLNFTPGWSPVFKPTWRAAANHPGQEELVPLAARLGRPLTSAAEAWDRPARRLADHDPGSYINDGFDEVQVYFAVTQLFETLIAHGWKDPELSTRPFDAFLYDPDVSYRDNAFYHDDTINFTTYSRDSGNMARDNTTIWHELGHGVMDRLMGDHIELADTGGLNEGMADFIAQLVLNDVTAGQSFPGQPQMRIISRTGFHLSNEIHDDGEAYGGAMYDVLTAAMSRWGKEGLLKVTDLTLEAMRLSRNHPGLTANDWFDRFLYADERGAPPVRQPGELRELILRALTGRNFNRDGSPSARFVLKNGNTEVLSSGPGSRPSPIPHKLKENETASYSLSVNLSSTPTFAFRYPVTVKVRLRGGPIQGGIHWKEEEAGAVFTRTLRNESDTATFGLTATGRCDTVNRPDGSCVDFAYIQIWNDGDTDKPVAKKRFYLRVHPQR